MSNHDQDLEVLHARRKRKRWRSFLNYSVVLLLLMLLAGTVAGIFAYQFGREALRDVKPSPPGVILPTIVPDVSPRPSPNQSFFLDKHTIISEFRNLQKQGLVRNRRPIPTAPQRPLAQVSEAPLQQLHQQDDSNPDQNLEQMPLGITPKQKPPENIS